MLQNVQFLFKKGEHLLTQHVKEKPVSNIALFDYGVNDFSPNESESDVEQVGSHLWTNNDDNSVDNNKEAKNAEENEPKPEENVHFFVDNVQGQQAQGIVLLHLA